jgi:N-acetylneuraminate synthase
MKRGYKARPHDLNEVMKLNPEFIEIHASSEDLEKEIEGDYSTVQLSVHLPEYDGSILLDPASSDPAMRDRCVKFYNNAITVARKWGEKFKGTPKVVIHPGGWSNEPVKQWERQGLYNSFKLFMQDLNDKDVDLLVENMPPHPIFYGGQWNCNIFTDPTECRDYCLGNGWGFCLDICHAYLFCNHIGANVIEFIKKVKPIIAHIHISDGKGSDGEGLQIGEGGMPLKEILNFINPIQVAVIPEVWQSHKDDFAGMKLAWERMDKILLDGGKQDV